jgi:hypothetical protein
MSIISASGDVHTNETSVEPPRRVDDEDSQTKKKL